MLLVPFEQRHKYPHMGKLDAAVWTRFIKEHPDFFVNVTYDLHVGEGAPEIPDLPDYLKPMSKHLSQKRIDAVGFKKSSIYIIEVKPVMDITAPGQAIAYARLFAKKFATSLPIIPTLVFERAQHDMIPLAIELGVITFQQRP